MSAPDLLPLLRRALTLLDMYHKDYAYEGEDKCDLPECCLHCETTKAMREGIDQAARIETDAAFAKGIEGGRLVILDGWPNSVNDCMYMGHYNGKDQFKHINTREYIV